MTTSRRAVLGAITLAPLTSIASGALGRAAPPVDAADSFLRARMAAKGIPGAGLAVTRPGIPDKVAAYGLASIELGIAATGRTVFPIASASKMLAGLAAGKLAEMGRLDLDAPARTYLPELPETVAGVRIHHLLSHTSGLRGPGANPDYAAQQAAREGREAYVGPLRLDVFTDDEILRYGAAVAPAEAPGARWRYNQFPYFLFGLIVARLSGRSYAEFVAETLLRPLGIAGALYGDHRTLVPGRNPINYTRQFGPLQNYALRYTPGYWPAAGLNLCAADALKLLSACRPGRLLRQETLGRLWQRARLNDGSEADYGLGFTVTTSNGRIWVGHEGGGCCYFGWWPREQLGLAILLNLSGSHEDGIEAALAETLLAGPPAGHASSPAL